MEGVGTQERGNMERDLFERGRFGRDTVVAALAFAYSVWAITGSGKNSLRRQHQSAPPVERAKSSR